MRHFPRVRVNSDNHMEEEITSKQEMYIHKEMAGMVLHEIAKEVGEVENEK